MADKELKGARISRGSLRNSARKNFGLLEALLKRLESAEEGQVNISEVAVLRGALQRTKESLDKYEASIQRCMVLEDKEEDPENEHVVEKEELEDKLDAVQFKVDGLLARVKEEHNAAKAQANVAAQGGNQGQTGNTGRITAKPPPALQKDVTLDEFITWSNTWHDYYSITKLEREAAATQRANLKSHLSQEMRGVVEHVLGIGEDTRKSCDDILKEIKSHIRSHRNVAIDKVAFENELISENQQIEDEYEDYLDDVIIDFKEPDATSTVSIISTFPQLVV